MKHTRAGAWKAIFTELPDFLPHTLDTVVVKRCRCVYCTTYPSIQFDPTWGQQRKHQFGTVNCLGLKKCTGFHNTVAVIAFDNISISGGENSDLYKLFHAHSFLLPQVVESSRDTCYRLYVREKTGDLFVYIAFKGFSVDINPINMYWF